MRLPAAVIAMHRRILLTPPHPPSPLLPSTSSPGGANKAQQTAPDHVSLLLTITPDMVQVLN